MNRVSAMPFFLLLFSAWLMMMALSFYASWLLLPDLLLLVLLAIQLHCPRRLRWTILLPFALLADVAAVMPLGFHGFYYALTVLLLFPFGALWSLISVAARTMLVLGLATAVVLTKWFFTFVLTGEPAANGWWLTVIGNVLCWPLVLWLVMLTVPAEVHDEHE